MDSECIQKIEQTLQVVLPEDYKQILLDYPDEIEAARELHLSSDATWLIEQNLCMRETPANFFGKQTWQVHHFVIGEDGNGNCFYLNLKEPLPSPIFFLDHETPDVDGWKIASNFAEWIQQVRAQLDEYDANEEQLRQNMEKKAQKARKPWWKFW